MPYRLRPSVHFGQVAEGVRFQAWDDEFVLRGPASLYHLCAHLVALLERGATRDQLSAGLPPNAQPVALYVVDELLKRNAVLDTERLTIAEVVPDVRAAFSDTIGYLESVSDDPYAAFAAFRRARLLAIGRGQSHFALVRALVTMGLGAIECWPSHDAVHAERLRTFLGERRTVNARVREDGAFEPAARSDSWDLVVYMSDALDHAELAEVDSHLRLDARAVIAGFATGPRGIIGPLRRERTDAGLRDAIAREAARGSADFGGAAGPSPVLAAVVGNIAAFEAFKWLALGACATAEGRAAVVAGDTLACSFHPVDAVAVSVQSSSRGLAARLCDFRKAVAPATAAEFLERLAAVTDPIFGLIDEPHPGSLPQTPLSLSATRLAAAEPEDVLIGIGRDAAEARYDAVIDGVKEVVRRATPAGPLELVGLDGRAGATLERSALEMAAGHSYADWLHDGMQRRLVALLVADALPMDVIRRAVTFDTCGDRAAKACWKSLALRFGRAIQVRHASAETLPGLHVATVADDAVLGIGAGATADAAIAGALRRALARVQLTRAGERIDGVSLLGVARPAADDAAAIESRIEEWPRALADRGWRVGVHPCAVEPAIRQHGLLLGWVGVHPHG